MSDGAKRGDSASDKDADAVRIVARDARGGRQMLVYQGLALFLVACSAGYALSPPRSAPARPGDDAEQSMEPPTEDGSVDAMRNEKNASGATAKSATPSAVTTQSGRTLTPRLTTSAPHGAPPRAAAPAAKDLENGHDPTQDLSDFIPPGHEDLTAGELIDELHKRGIYEGIGAFPPPGTSPPMEGMAVPDDYELPLGYVRHYQATDDGQAIDPILMFSPDYEFFDENGQPIQIPANRVVPPELAPPGFPIRPIQMPPKREPGDTAR